MTAASDLPWPLLHSVASLVHAPMAKIAASLHEAILPFVKSTALVIFTEDCKGRAQKKEGEEEIISRISIAELEELRAGLSDETPWLGEAVLAGRPRPALAMKHASSHAILVLTDPFAADPGDNPGLELLTYLWGITARRIQEKVADAPPSYLAEAQVASAERVRVTEELTNLHLTTLATLLAALRSSSLEDAAARTTAADLTARGLEGLRTLSDLTTDLVWSKNPSLKRLNVCGKICGRSRTSVQLRCSSSNRR